MLADCQGLSRFVKVCQGLSRFVKVCQGLSRFVKVCQGLSTDCQPSVGEFHPTPPRHSLPILDPP